MAGVWIISSNLDAWESTHFLNLTAVNELIKIAYPYINNSNNNVASIINVASIYGSTAPDWSLYEVVDNPLAYNTSKLTDSANKVLGKIFFGRILELTLSHLVGLKISR